MDIWIVVSVFMNLATVLDVYPYNETLQPRAISVWTDHYTFATKEACESHIFKSLAPDEEMKSNRDARKYKLKPLHHPLSTKTRLGEEEWCVKLILCETLTDCDIFKVIEERRRNEKCDLGLEGSDYCQ